MFVLGRKGTGHSSKSKETMILLLGREWRQNEKTLSQGHEPAGGGFCQEPGPLTWRETSLRTRLCFWPQREGLLLAWSQTWWRLARALLFSPRWLTSPACAPASLCELKLVITVTWQSYWLDRWDNGWGKRWAPFPGLCASVTLSCFSCLLIPLNFSSWLLFSVFIMICLASFPATVFCLWNLLTTWGLAFQHGVCVCV